MELSPGSQLGKHVQYVQFYLFEPLELERGHRPFSEEYQD